MDELEKLREEIDDIDRQLVHFFEERMDKVLQVAAYKKRFNMPVQDISRENKVLAKNRRLLKNRLYQESLDSFFLGVMAISRNLQDNLLSKSSEREQD
ncbi:MAG: chorismate mutase [Desulfitobacteriaceae bacterium]|nr:chorismate mutase [Desulfitobacteriaceae bacterium]MDD4753330.1 chorismate mutase [Desulfitobacteriaceae bacterium]